MPCGKVWTSGLYIFPGGSERGRGRSGGDIKAIIKLIGVSPVVKCYTWAGGGGCGARGLRGGVRGRGNRGMGYKVLGIEEERGGARTCKC